MPGAASWSGLDWPRRLRPASSIRFRHSEFFLGDEAQDELFGNWSQALRDGLREQPLYLVFLRVAHSAMREHRMGGRTEGRTPGEKLRRICIGATGLFAVVERGRFHRHQPCRLDGTPDFRERMLDGLVLADGSIEYDALPCIARGATQRVLGDSDRTGGDDDTLGVEAVQEVVETLPFFADSILLGNEQVLDENRIRVDGGPAQLRNPPHFDLLPV